MKRVERNVKEDIEMMENSKEKITKVTGAIERMADNGLYIIESREDMSVKKKKFDTWFRLITRHQEVKPETIKERYSKFSDYFKDKETKEIIDAIEMVGKVIDTQANSIRGKAEKVMRILANKMIEPELKAELIVKRMTSITEGAKLIENFLSELIYCIICGHDFLNFNPGRLNSWLTMHLQKTYYSRQTHNISLLGNISENTPVLNMDNEKIPEVIEGLLSIFTKNIPRGGKLLVNLAPEEKYVTLQIAGNSVNLDKDFEPFHSEGDEIVFNSLMYSYKRIIEAHGGTIDFQSKPEYSAFTIKLPIADS